ncbi:MAG: hypothetical protein NT166_00725 [Candidatus Aminicenantes bacterium]|nr:hypothetical protein [Candidatus Aminicenantes bacterium]
MMNDLEILSQLEKESGMSLTKRLLEEIMYYYSGAGYTLDENEHIIGFNLSYLKTGQLPASLSKLSNLRERIDLAGNPLEKPPLEIIKKGKEAMRAYFADPGAYLAVI